MDGVSGRRLAGKVILVTGGGTAIGRVAALAFAREGGRVVVADHDLAVAEAVAHQAAAAGEVAALRLDVTRPADVEAVVADIVARYGRLDGLVHETDPTVWDQTFAVNVTGAFLCSQATVRQMLAQGGGVIVNLALIVNAPDVAPVFDAAQTAVLQLTRVIALQYAAQHIRCNAIVAGAAAAQPEQIAPALVFLASEDASYLTGVAFPVDASVV
jgi:NAD(P)-dependent dehydrogenase (short-subunit alcohol dehydrogenase family)